MLQLLILYVLTLPTRSLLRSEELSLPSFRTQLSSKPFPAMFTPKILLIGNGGTLVFPQH